MNIHIYNNNKGIVNSNKSTNQTLQIIKKKKKKHKYIHIYTYTHIHIYTGTLVRIN